MRPHNEGSILVGFCVSVWNSKYWFLSKYKRDGHVVIKSDRWVSSGYSVFLPHEDHANATIGANKHD